jgi:hypothetical protein
VYRAPDVLHQRIHVDPGEKLAANLGHPLLPRRIGFEAFGEAAQPLREVRANLMLLIVCDLVVTARLFLV